LFASEHTRLINRLIGLCTNTLKWPTLLFDLGCDVQLIEQTISLKFAHKINPDVVMVSNKHYHVLVTDYKSGNNIDTDQDSRYGELSSIDLKYYVTIHDQNQLTHTVTYVYNHTNHSNLKSFTNHSFITFNNEHIQGTGDFGYRELNDKLQNSTSLSGMREPTGYYPFSPEDEDYVIAPHMLRGLISYLTIKGRKTKSPIKNLSTSLEILKIIHPYDLVSTRHKDQLTKKIELMIDVFMKSSNGFSEQISKLEKGEYSTVTLRSLVKICQELIDNYENQKKITDTF